MLAASPVPMIGRATLTTEPSRMAMPDPMIVAANTQGLESSGHLPATDADRMTPSAHGLVRSLIIPTASAATPSVDAENYHSSGGSARSRPWRATPFLCTNPVPGTGTSEGSRDE